MVLILIVWPTREREELCNYNEICLEAVIFAVLFCLF